MDPAVPNPVVDPAIDPAPTADEPKPVDPQPEDITGKVIPNEDPVVDPAPVEPAGDDPDPAVTPPTEPGTEPVVETPETPADPGEESAEAVPPVPASPVEPAAPSQATVVPDPGEYKPNDYSFQVTLADGERQRIRSPEEAEAIAKNPDNFKTPAQLLEFIRKTTRMENNLEADKRDYDTKKTQHDEYVAQEQVRNETLDGWVKEIDYLAETGKLPKVAAQYKNADWADPEVAKQPGVKEQLDLLQYVQEENSRREKAGLPPIRSMEQGYYQMMDDKRSKTDQANDQAAAEARKARGAMVGGATGAQPTTLPKDVIAGEGGSLSDLNSYSLNNV